jgi:hypothetical protein
MRFRSPTVKKPFPGEVRNWDRSKHGAVVLMLQLSTAHPRQEETHHDRTMNPTSAAVTRVCRPPCALCPNSQARDFDGEDESVRGVLGTLSALAMD